MAETREQELARVMLDHSLAVGPREKVLITASIPAAFPLVKEVFVEVLKRGAYPLLDMDVDSRVGRMSYNGLMYQFFQLANEWQIAHVPEEVIKAKMAWADKYVRIVAEENTSELAEVDPTKIAKRARLMRPLTDPMTDSGKWVLTYYPTAGMAQEAGMSLDNLRELYYASCLVDYEKMRKELTGLEKILDGGKEVRVRGKQTDLRLNIKGRLAKACYGKSNLPDGEVYVGPLHTKVEGEVYFDLPTKALGREVSGIRLEFVAGKVIKAAADKG